MFKKILTRVLIGLAVVLVVAVIGFLAWTRIARYAAISPAVAIASGTQVSQGWYVFQPQTPNGTGLIIYPGGLVDPAAYAPLARLIADSGALVVIVPMPLDLAVFGINNADPVFTAYPEVQHWALAGHSLGGSMAAQYIANRASSLGKLGGLALWASYSPDGTDLSQLPIKAVSIYGTFDGVMNRNVERLKGLPAGTPTVVIEGGNHAGFGSYGAQAGDQPATITPEQQWKQVADATVEMMQKMGK
jgi:hypothetical protein